MINNKNLGVIMMTKVKEVPFLIIGGGIGGLATALGISETGRSVHVLEQAPEFNEIGAGIQLGPNASAVLDQLGVLKDVHEHSVFPKRFVYMDAVSGEALTPIDFGKSFEDRYGYPYIVLHRSDLHKVLLDACLKKKNIILHTNQQVISVQSQSNKKAVVTCQDGTILHCGSFSWC